MKINWDFLQPVQDQATRLRGDYSAQSAIVKLAEQQAEIEKLREENALLHELLWEARVNLDANNFWNLVAAAIRGGGKDDAA